MVSRHTYQACIQQNSDSLHHICSESENTHFRVSFFELWFAWNSHQAAKASSVIINMAITVISQ